jgi:Sec-independent protein translocase protein TatA
LNAVHVVVILAVALVVAGPSKLPELARKGAGLLQDYRLFRERLHTEVEQVIEGDEAQLGFDHEPGEPPGRAGAAEPAAVEDRYGGDTEHPKQALDPVAFPSPNTCAARDRSNEG